MISDLLKSAIETYKCNPKDNLFLYASSVAAPAAIMHGILFEAHGVYLNTPIVQSKDTTLYKITRKDNFDFPFDPNNRDVIESNMIKFLKAHKDKNLPTFFICDSLHQSEDWLQNFLEEHTLYFANACKQEGTEVHLELLDTEGHKIHHSTQEIIKIFEKHTPPKYLDIMSITISLEEHVLKVSCTLGKDYPQTGNELFAFYLMYKGERVQVRSYAEDRKALFDIDENMHLNEIEVIGFIKDDEGKVIKEKVGITK